MSNIINVNEITKKNIDSLSNCIYSTNEKENIITVNSLTSSISVLMYIESKKCALSINISSDIDENIIKERILLFLMKNNYLNENIKYLIIPGSDEYFKNNKKLSEIKNNLEKSFMYEPFKFTKLNYNKFSVKLNEETKSLEYAFDANTGKFVTSTLYPNDLDYCLYDRMFTFKKIDNNIVKLESNYLNLDEIYGVVFKNNIRFFDEYTRNGLFKLSRDIKRFCNMNSKEYEVENNEIVLDKNIFKNGYVICICDNYFDIIRKNNLINYLNYYHFPDITNKLKDNRKITLNNRIYEFPIDYEENETKKK